MGSGVTQTIERVSHSNSMPLSDATKELVAQITEAPNSKASILTGLTQAVLPTATTWLKPVFPSLTDAALPGEFHCDREFLRLDTVEERIRMITRFLSLI